MVVVQFPIMPAKLWRHKPLRSKLRNKTRWAALLGCCADTRNCGNVLFEWESLSPMLCCWILYSNWMRTIVSRDWRISIKPHRNCSTQTIRFELQGLFRGIDGSLTFLLRPSGMWCWYCARHQFPSGISKIQERHEALLNAIEEQEVSGLQVRTGETVEDKEDTSSIFKTSCEAALYLWFFKTVCFYALIFFYLRFIYANVSSLLQRTQWRTVGKEYCPSTLSRSFFCRWLKVT